MTAPTEKTVAIALGGYDQVPDDWVSATAIRPLVFEDPAIIWLDHHGAEHGFEPSETEYDFVKFIANKARGFEKKWCSESAPEGRQICQEPWEVRSADKVQETINLMAQLTPVLIQPALWWAPEKVYGVPDAIALRSWVIEKFPNLGELLKEDDSGEDYYIVLDLKFTTKLDSNPKVLDRKNYEAQVRIYSYILGQIQKFMPEHALIITRDRISDPLPVRITAEVDHPLEPDLITLRDTYLNIKHNGAAYTPWTHVEVTYNLNNDDERWGKTKSYIAKEKVPGGDPALVYYVSERTKEFLQENGISRLDALLATTPGDVPWEECPGIGAKRASQIRAVLQANGSGLPLKPPEKTIPIQRDYEFFIDYEFLNNLNVDFETQWPNLEGREMVFMIGVGYEDGGEFQFETFIATSETAEAEQELVNRFIDFLQEKTNGKLLDQASTAMYHWTSAEKSQSKRVADRHQLSADHPFRNLSWVDLQKPFLDGPGALPGALAFGLKHIANALSSIAPEYSVAWPGELDDGLKAAVMGWRAYEDSAPLETEEMRILREYLTTDCKALWQVLRWLRD